jgi:hypothetical protein
MSKKQQRKSVSLSAALTIPELPLVEVHQLVPVIAGIPSASVPKSMK